MWGIAGQSAGPPKRAGEKKRIPGHDRSSCGTDPNSSTQKIPRGRGPILSTQTFFYGACFNKNLLRKMSAIEKNFRAARACSSEVIENNE